MVSRVAGSRLVGVAIAVARTAGGISVAGDRGRLFFPPASSDNSQAGRALEGADGWGRVCGRLDFLCGRPCGA